MASFFSVPCPKTSSLLALHLNPNHQTTSLSLLLHSNFTESSSFKIQATKKNQNGVVKVSAQRNKVVRGKSLNSVSPLENSGNISSSETTVPDVESVTTFMNQVAGLVKQVDSTDIMELQLKQGNCEVLIRKKEALAPPPASPIVTMQSSQPHALFQSQPPPPQAAPTLSAPAPSAPALAPEKSKSSHPPLKCSMAGTFYRAPAPGAPPFVKVGDKVQKGQVICIIEAMKLMNEIEADQSGTIVDIIAEDGKPVSLDAPLFVIEP